MDAKSPMKSPIDFADLGDWREYVRQAVSPEEAAYTLAFGRTSMLLRFYETRNQPFPVRFRDELGDIIHLRDPVRTQALETLNDRIFADMTHFLSVAAQPVNSEKSDVVASAAPRELEDLLNYLAKENPCFALWVSYTKRAESHADGPSWEEFVTNKLAAATDQDVEFALLMGQLAKLLHHFRKVGLALPPHYFGRIWFLHFLRGAERNAQTRAVVQGLTEAMRSCACA